MHRKACSSGRFKRSRYWVSEYDWRKVETRLNEVPNFITEVHGLDIHFIHVRSKHENALPLIVTHGWHGRRGLMVMTNPGHPPTLRYRASRAARRWLEAPHDSKRERPASVPLGLLADVTYDRLIVKPGRGLPID